MPDAASEYRVADEPRPRRVLLCEVGPRDGFQYEETVLSTELKVDVIAALARAGLPRIQALSFVHPKWVPQMADAEEVLSRLPVLDGVTYSGLVLNRKGLDRALAIGLRAVDISIATWDEHSLKNANMSVHEAVEEAASMVTAAKEAGIEVQVGFQTVFGYRTPGDTPAKRVAGLVARFAALGADSISLADTTGLAHPYLVAQRVEVAREAAGGTPIVLHLHDTRGLGLANVHEAVRQGVERFDTSLAGMGGCPFIAGAAGNVATEDTAYLLHALGLDTGVRIDAVAAVSRRVADVLGKSFPGKLYRLPS